MEEKLRITQIEKVNDVVISQINSLLDKGTFWNNEQGEKFLANDDNILLLAYWEDQIAGFLTGYRLQRLDKRKAEVLLYEIEVHENFRKKGIGKALIASLKNWAKEVGADEIWVLTNRSNTAAMALYASAGGATESSDEQMYVIKI